MMGNPFIHAELHTRDVASAKRFYGSLFEWTLEDLPDMPYTMIRVGSGTGGGMMQSKDPNGDSRWFPFIAVDDIRSVTEHAKALGGTVLKGPCNVEGYGWYSVILDPTGAQFGVWDSKVRTDAERI